MANLTLTPEEEQIILKRRKKQEAKEKRESCIVNSLKELYDEGLKRAGGADHDSITFGQFEEQYQEEMKVIALNKKDPYRCHNRLIRSLDKAGWVSRSSVSSDHYKLAIRYDPYSYKYRTGNHSEKIQSFVAAIRYQSLRDFHDAYAPLWKNPEGYFVTMDYRGTPIIYTDIKYYQEDFEYCDKQRDKLLSSGRITATITNNLCTFEYYPFYNIYSSFTPKLDMSKIDDKLKPYGISIWNITRHYNFPTSFRIETVNKALSIEAILKTASQLFKKSVQTSLKQNQNDKSVLKKILQNCN